VWSRASSVAELDLGLEILDQAIGEVALRCAGGAGTGPGVVTTPGPV